MHLLVQYVSLLQYAANAKPVKHLKLRMDLRFLILLSTALLLPNTIWRKGFQVKLKTVLNMINWSHIFCFTGICNESETIAVALTLEYILVQCFGLEDVAVLEITNGCC